MVASLDITKPPPPHRGPIPSIDLEMARQNAANCQEEQQKMTGNGEMPKDGDDDLDYRGPKQWRVLVKNWPIISQPLALLIVVILLWAIAHTYLPDHTRPESTAIRIGFLFVGAQISGILVTFLRLPDMLGMLFWGVLYTNVGLASFTGFEGFEAFLREMALINIMLLAGLGLDLKAFKKFFGMVMRLTLIPTAAEVVIIAVLAHFLLQMPWLWGLLLGFVITAISPNVVVTVMLRLREERLGLNNGIHTIIYAMTACNDVVAIFLFGVFLGVIFSTGTLTQQLLQGPVGIAIGIVFGFLYGLMLMYIPSKKSLGPWLGPWKYVNGLRLILVALGGTISVMGSRAIGYPSAGALGCVAIAVVSNEGWHRQSKSEYKYVHEKLDLMWKFLKPVSFSLIGKEVNFSVLDGKVVGFGVVLILLGLLLRLGTSFVSTYGGGLTWKERAYITLSGLPKATVQASLGPIALDLARTSTDPDTLDLAKNVLITSVLAIILTAPIGAILMIRLAPLWLQKTGIKDVVAVQEQNLATRKITTEVIEPPSPRSSISSDTSGREQERV